MLPIVSFIQKMVSTRNSSHTIASGVVKKLIKKYPNVKYLKIDIHKVEENNVYFVIDIDGIKKNRKININNEKKINEVSKDNLIQYKNNKKNGDNIVKNEDNNKKCISEDHCKESIIENHNNILYYHNFLNKLLNNKLEPKISFMDLIQKNYKEKYDKILNSENKNVEEKVTISDSSIYEEEECFDCDDCQETQKMLFDCKNKIKYLEQEIEPLKLNLINKDNEIDNLKKLYNKNKKDILNVIDNINKNTVNCINEIITFNNHLHEVLNKKEFNKIVPYKLSLEKNIEMMEKRIDKGIDILNVLLNRNN